MNELKKEQNTITWQKRSIKGAVPEIVEHMAHRLKRCGPLVVKDITFDRTTVTYYLNARCVSTVTNELGAFVDGFLKAREVYKK